MPLLEINDTHLFVREVGQGRPALVMHGGLGSDHSYLRGLDPLSDLLRLVYYDHRGNGRSAQVDPASITFDSLCGDAAGLCSALGVDRTVVIGQSFGGYVALELALRVPDLVSHLVLMDTAPRAPTPEENERALALAIERHPDLEDLFLEPWAQDDAGFAAQCRRLRPLFFHRDDANLADRIYRDVISRVAAMQRGQEILKDWDVTDRLAEIRCPTLITAGRWDINVPVEHAHTLHRGIAGSECALFEHSAHQAHVEEPEQFLSTVREWLARHP